MIYKDNIEKATIKNTYFRKVINTTKEMQLVYMSVNPYDELGSEVHPTTSQFIRVEEGNGVAIIGDKRFNLSDGSAVLIPSKTRHNIIAGKNGLKLYTIYSPPEHSKNCIQKINNIHEC